MLERSLLCASKKDSITRTREHNLFCNGLRSIASSRRAFFVSCGTRSFASKICCAFAVYRLKTFPRLIIFNMRAYIALLVVLCVVLPAYQAIKCYKCSTVLPAQAKCDDGQAETTECGAGKSCYKLSVNNKVHDKASLALFFVPNCFSPASGLSSGHSRRLPTRFRWRDQRHGVRVS